MRAWLGGTAAILFIVLVAIWQVPQYLDWIRYRAAIEALASASLGQPVAIHGPIALDLLPEPVLTAAQVDVGGEGSARTSIHVDALRLRVALWPLLAGRVDARELVLRGPDLHIPWPSESSWLLALRPAWLSAFTARVENGQLTVGRLTFSGIDATLASQDTGALIASGVAQFSGQNCHFTVRLTAAGADGAAGLNVSLDGQGEAAGLVGSFAGQLASDGTLAGTISGHGPNLAQLLPAPPVPFRGDGRLTFGAGLAAVDQLALAVGGAPASGAIALRVAPNQRLDIALSASRLDLDAWLPVLIGAGTSVGGISLPIGIDFSVESAPLGGGTLEHLRAAFELSDQFLTLREGSAKLPGNGRLLMTGRIARSSSADPRFEGDARLDAPVLRTTLRWLGDAAPGLFLAHDLARLPNSALRRVALSAHVVAGGGEVQLQRLAGSVDDSSIAGSVGFTRGAPATLAANLALDHLTLDDWSPQRLDHFRELARLAAGIDARLRLSIRKAVIGGSEARDVDIDAGIASGTVSVRRLNADILGLRLSASGSLAEDGRVSDGELHLVSDDATPLAAMLPPAWRATPALWHGPIRFAMRAAGPPDALALGIALTLADIRLDAQPTIDVLSGRWSGDMTLSHPRARRLLEMIGLPERTGLPDLPVWLGEGSLSVAAHLNGAPNRFAADSFEITAAARHLVGMLALDLGGVEARLGGRIGFDALQLPVPDRHSDTPLPVGALHGWQGELAVTVGRLNLGSGPALYDASAIVTVAKDALRVTQFDATFGGGRLSGACLFDAAAGPPSFALRATLSKADIAGPLADNPIDLRSGSIAAGLDLSASGYSPATIVATLAGHVTATITDGVLGGVDLYRLKQAVEKPDPAAAEQAAGDALLSGSTGFDRLEIAGSLAHGDLSLDSVQLLASSGEMNVTGDVNLPTMAVDLRVALRPALENSPEIAIRLTGPLDRPNRMPELANLARYIAEREH